MRRALGIDEKSYGPEHPRVGIDLNNLARLLYVAKRLAEAEPLYRRALAVNEKSYGPEHPIVATTLNNLAQLLRETNRLGEAELLMGRALAIDEKSYGLEHPEVARDLNNLAFLLNITNRSVEAEPLTRRQLEIFFLFTFRTGHSHPHLQNAIGNYTMLLKKLGWNKDKINERIDELREEVKKPGFKLLEQKV